MIGMAAALVAAWASRASAQDFSAIQTRLTADCAASRFSGAVLVAVGGQERFFHACGLEDADSGRPITRATRFRIFSTSKLLTALAVMRLVESGHMRLDEPLTSYIPDAPAKWRSITVRHLLGHTSGLPDRTEALLAAFSETHPRAMRTVLAAETAAGTEAAQPPGSAWRYNNFGYELLADAVAHVTGKPFQQALFDLVLMPAGMRSVVVETAVAGAAGLSAAPDALLATGYNGSAGQLRRANPLSYVQLGAGAVHASVSDFVALDRALASGHILSPASLAEMRRELWSRGQRHDRRGYGLGVMIRGENGLEFVGHDGGVNGYLSDFERYPAHGAMMVVLTNYGFADTDWMRVAVGEALRAR